MRRPSMRMALVLALLAGVAAVASKVRRGRDAALPVAPAPSTTWPPLDEPPTSPPVVDPVAAPAPAPAPAPPAPAASPAGAVPHDEDDTDPRLVLGSTATSDDPSLEPEPEAVLPAPRIEAASARSDLIADGAGADVPPAPEPTFGTAPDPDAAATAAVPVATPVEPDEDDPLPVPQPGATDPSSAERPAGGEVLAGSGDSPTETSRWIPPVAGACAPSHPVKAKLASRIFHLPGMVDYERMTPDRCYLDAAAAEADGLRAAKR